MNRVLLMILDGWGEGRHDHSNAIYTQGTPNIDALRAKYPFSHLQACGKYVGLPDGQMGNRSGFRKRQEKRRQTPPYGTL